MLVVGVSLSVNLSSLTIEQVIGKFRKLVGDAAMGSSIEARSSMMASTAPENADGVAELVRLACGERGLLRRGAEFFNDDKNLSWAMDAVVKVKQAALAAARLRVFNENRYARELQEGEEGGVLGLESGEFKALLCEQGQDLEKVVALPGWLPESRLMSSLQTLKLQSLASLASLESLSGCTALQTLTLLSLDSLASLEGLSGCTALQTLTLGSLKSLASLEGLSGCTALQTLTLGDLKSLASLEGLSGCTALQTLTLRRLESLASLEGLSGCTALQTLELHSLESLASMPDLSSLTDLKVEGLPKNLQPWENGVRKRCSL